MYYAQLNENNLCVGLSDLGGEVDNPLLIPVETPDMELLGKQYANGGWEDGETPEPEPEPGPTLSELKEEMKMLKEELDMICSHTELIQGGLIDIYETLLGGE